MHRLQCLSCAVVIGLALRLSAQTITYTDPILNIPDSAITTPPKVGWYSKPEFPDEMKKTPEIGYAIIQESVSDGGKLTSSLTEANAIPIERAFGPNAAQWTLKRAKINNTQVATTAWFSVIFNPKPYSGTGFDVAPQLIRVSPILAKLKGASAPSYRFRAKVTIDESGKVSGVAPEDFDDIGVTNAINRAMEKWEFVPATLTGKHVVSTVSMALVVRALFKQNHTNETAPVVVHQNSPVYPFAMRYLGVKGEVLVDFVVTKDGTVDNAWAMKTSAPWFEAPAVDAVRQWTFKPGVVDGVPVNAHMQVPIVFQLNDTPDGGDDAFRVESARRAKGEFAPQITGIVTPIYPYDPVTKDQNGKAKVRIFIGTQGRPLEVEVLEASSPEFGQALAAAALGFNFVPGFKDGKPVVSGVVYESKFDTYDPQDRDRDRVIATEHKHPGEIRNGNELDHPLHPISRRPVVAPPTLTTADTAMIEFLVDQKGKVQLPRIVSPNPDLFAYAAVQAIGSWLFDPPMVNGEAVIVRARIPMVFKPNPPTPPAS